MSKERALRVVYDRSADVLYVTARHEPAAKGVEDKEGIVWRYDRRGLLIGATILDYRSVWHGHERADLFRKLSEQFKMPETEIRRAVGD